MKFKPASRSNSARRFFSPAGTSLGLLSAAFVVCSHPDNAHAWGKRGHAIVCQTAAYIASDSPKAGFLKSHSFDLGYYCNVPDLVWKKPATYEVEWTNHFMDLEIFERGMKDSKAEKPFEMDRLAFNAEFPQIEDKAGRAWWRIRELSTSMKSITGELSGKELTREQRHKLQADWLLHAGVIGHYVGDLSQPLHVTENYDGQMTDQKGIHAFFEDALVDENFHVTGRMHIEQEVMLTARRRWLRDQKTLAQKSQLELLQQLTSESNKALADLLKTDKKTGRKDVRKAATAHRGMMVRQMALGSVILAEIYRREIGWEYDGQKFYTFVSSPEFISPPKAPAPSPTPSTKK
jgi:hypothetical protein